MKISVVEPIGITEEIFKKVVNDQNVDNLDIKTFDSRPSSEDEFIERVGDAEVMMVVNQPVTTKIISKCPNLKMISVAFTGYDHVDLDACRERGIVVCNAAGYSTHSVAELATGMMIDLLRYVVEGDRRVREGGTRAGIVGSELRSKIVGVIGTGAIGTRVIEIVKAFGCEVLAHSRSEREEVKNLGAKYVELDELLRNSDIVTVHTPLNSDTKNLIGSKELSLMKKSAILIQTSRGGTVNEKDLKEALDNEVIAGAGVDVFEVEPPLPQDYELLSAKNILVTPHVAFATKEALKLRANIAFGNIKAWVDGRPQNQVS